MIQPNQIRAARSLLGLTQADLAALSGVSEISIKNIERGVTDPRTSTLSAIVAALESAGVVFVQENGDGPGVRLRGLKPGDRVRPKKNIFFWGGYPDVRNLVGEIVAFVDTGTSVKKVDVKFSNGQVLRGVDLGLFDRALGV